MNKMMIKAQASVSVWIDCVSEHGHEVDGVIFALHGIIPEIFD